MKKVFLTSSVHKVAHAIANQLGDTVGRKLVFITTASELETDDLSWQDADRAALVKAGFQVTDYTVTGKDKAQIKQDLRLFDVIHIEGGNTYYLLQKIQESDCAQVIIDLVNQGVPYIGCSAGSIVAGPDIYPIRHIDPLKEFRRLKSYTGLGLVNFIVLPHWGQSHSKDLYLGKRMRFNYNQDHKLFLLTDNQYIYIENDWMKFIDVRLDK